METIQHYTTLLGLCFVIAVSPYLMSALVGFIAAKLVISQYRSRISGKGPSPGQICQEILSSIRSSLIFTAFWFAAMTNLTGHSRMYADVDQFGWVYCGVSLLLLIVLHDTFVYWTHRAIHHPLLFRHCHRAHHTSVHPTPFATYLFDVPEAMMHGLFFFVVGLVLPLNWGVLILVLWISGISNAIGHLGYEPAPASWLGWLGKVLNTTTHHDLHHSQGGRYNYGVYFRFWDWIMGTEHPDYEVRFVKAITK